MATHLSSNDQTTPPRGDQRRISTACRGRHLSRAAKLARVGRRLGACDRRSVVTTEPPVAEVRRWYKALSRAQWSALVASNLGWVFDGYESYALVLAANAALRQLVDPSRAARFPIYSGLLVGLTLLGWGVGGVVGGVLADYLGRKRTMILTILSYSLVTGLSALAWSFSSFLVLRLLVGVAIGSEWVTGASIVAEMWPDRARGRGVGLMQCGLGIGFFLASLTWLAVGSSGPGAWRTMFLLGVLPALLTLWLRRAIPESEIWVRIDHRRRAALARLRSGAPIDEGERALTRFTLAEIFREPELRRRSVVAFLMSLTTTFAFWGIAAWVPPFVAAAAARAALSGPRWAGYAGLAFNAGAIGGYIALGFLADAWGRKPTTLLYMAASLALVPVLFLWTADLRLMLLVAAGLGWFALGQFTWMAAWLPELYPTRMRATGAALAFNGPRFVAWLGPLVSGTLIATFGGFSQAALAVSSIYVLGLLVTPLLPETRGQPLPEDT
jgi:MFS family permease